MKLMSFVTFFLTFSSHIHLQETEWKQSFVLVEVNREWIQSEHNFWFFHKSAANTTQKWTQLLFTTFHSFFFLWILISVEKPRTFINLHTDNTINLTHILFLYILYYQWPTSSQQRVVLFFSATLLFFFLYIFCVQEFSDGWKWTQRPWEAPSASPRPRGEAFHVQWDCPWHHSRCVGRSHCPFCSCGRFVGCRGSILHYTHSWYCWSCSRGHLYGTWRVFPKFL